MQFCSFSYLVSGNIGDEIQSLAAEQHLPRLDRRLNRGSLSHVSGPHQREVIMNGRFVVTRSRVAEYTEAVGVLLWTLQHSSRLGESEEGLF